MRSFAYVNPDFEQDSVVPELVEGNPCYVPSAYDPVMLEELSDGSYMYMDMTSILLNQEKYRRLPFSFASFSARTEESFVAISSLPSGYTPPQHCQFSIS